VRQGSMWKGLAWMLCVLAGQGLLAQGALGSQAARRWAWDQAKTWRCSKRDAQGKLLWEDKPLLSLPYGEQNEQLLGRLKGEARERRAALVVLGDRPLDHWARAALLASGNRDEVAHFLHFKGYRLPGKDPFAYLEPSSLVARPWTQGLGLHLEGPGAWRFQWIPEPVLLPSTDAAGVLPRALEQAAQPSAILHLRQFRGGLARLRALAGGPGGMVQALARGSRAGFFASHLEPWLERSSVALAPLADREVWVLHYGLERGGPGPSGGTLVFLPGTLPASTRMFLELLRLNPTSRGARARVVTWTGAYGGQARVIQVRGAGGVLNVCATKDGTWICDREAPLRSALFPAADVTLGERLEWCKVALAGMRPRTEISLWLLPRLGAGAAFERTALRRRLLGGRQKTWNNPCIAKAAPRSGTLSVALGAGPTEPLVASLLRKDQEAPIEDPELPKIADGGGNLTPEQQEAYLSELQAARSRREARKVLRQEADALLATLDLRGAAFYWKGWVAAPPLSIQEQAAQAEFRKLQTESRYQARRRQREGKAGFYGGFGEPGMTPSVALALPVRPEGRGALEAALRRLWSHLFKGRLESREYAKGVQLHRIRTAQAFTPCYALVGDTLVAGSDDAAVQSIAGGLLGQAPTIADLQGRSFGTAHLDGVSAAGDLETLLLAYLRTTQGGGAWWFGEPSPSDDDASAEVASTFGPFLGAMKALGTRTLQVEWTPAGLEAWPR